ncbi:MAG: thioredoxin family protein [Candidatus Riflemargulisbacteria bacterium]
MLNTIINNAGQVSTTYNACSPDAETTTENTLTGVQSYTSSSITSEDDNVEISSGPTTSDEPISWGSDYDSAIAQAKAEGKQVIIIFGRPECGNCTRTQNNANGSPEVRGEINDNYIAIHVNIDTPEGRAAYTPYRAGLPASGWMLPLTCVVDPNNEGTAVVRTTGTQTAGALLSTLQQGMEGKTTPTSDGSASSHSGGRTNSFSSASGFNATFNRNEFILGLTSGLLADVISDISTNDDDNSGYTETGEISNPDHIPANNTTASVATTLPPISAE